MRIEAGDQGLERGPKNTITHNLGAKFYIFCMEIVDNVANALFAHFRI